MAYLRYINNNTKDSHQISPAYVLTFINWRNRDTVNYSTSTDPAESVKEPLVVINDAVKVDVTESKTAVTGSLNITLRAGDINYATAVAPGDFVMVNLVDSEDKALEIRGRALTGKNINRYYDGFKGLYKVQKVRRVMNVNPQTGQKTYQFVVHAFSFTELNTVIYYNPAVQKAFQEANLLFLSNFADFWSTISTSKNNLTNVQEVLVRITKALLGVGLLQKSADIAMAATANDQFIMPGIISKLMGIPKTKTLTVSDAYRFIFGVWSNKTISNSGNALKDKFNIGIKKLKGHNSFYQAEGGVLQGWRLVAAEDFNYKKIWSIIQSYMNAGINESYTCNRIDKDTGNVLPTIIIRQKPFNSLHYSSSNKSVPDNLKIPHTKYFDLPRWSISPDLIYGVDLGKDEIGRVNYVQLYGRSVSILPAYNEAIQAQNIFFDRDDIKRHGLKPSIITSNFDFPPDDTGAAGNQAKKWTYLLFDMLNAGQNRESGSITCQGIVEPICIGDNFQFDGNVYHIESVSHTMQVTAGGTKVFRTILNLSFGTNLASNGAKPVYPQQKNIYVDKERQEDFDSKQKILPGYSDSQYLGQGDSQRSLGDLTGSATQKRLQNSKGFTGTADEQVGANRVSTVNFDLDRKRLPKKDSGEDGNNNTGGEE